MATLSIDKRSGKTAGYNIQWHEGKKRRTIHLGGKRYAKKTAVRLKEIIEELLYYQRNGITVPGKATEHWLQNAPACIRAKLAKAGLLTVQEAKTCQQLWDEFLKQKTDIKSKTVKAYNECRVHFFKAFAPEESVETITSERLQEWKHSLLKTHAVASVAGYIKNLKAVLKWAVKKEWLPKNPLEGITRGSFVNRDKALSMACCRAAGFGRLEITILATVQRAIDPIIPGLTIVRPPNLAAPIAPLPAIPSPCPAIRSAVAGRFIPALCDVR